MIILSMNVKMLSNSIKQFFSIFSGA